MRIDAVCTAQIRMFRYVAKTCTVLGSCRNFSVLHGSILTLGVDSKHLVVVKVLFQAAGSVYCLSFCNHILRITI